MIFATYGCDNPNCGTPKGEPPRPNSRARAEGTLDRAPEGWIALTWSPGVLSSSRQKPRTFHYCTEACKEAHEPVRKAYVQGGPSGAEATRRFNEVLDQAVNGGKE